MRILISNLSIYASERQLGELFSQYGQLSSVTIVYDKYTNRSRGMGYVEMNTYAGHEKAILRLNNTLFMNKKIQVSSAGRPGVAK